jgi:hypothetical protein
VNSPPTSDADQLGLEFTEADMIHEATHYLDFTRLKHRFAQFDLDHLDDLSGKYYNTPQEFNAFFLQAFTASAELSS